MKTEDNGKSRKLIKRPEIEQVRGDDAGKQVETYNEYREVWKRFKRNKLAVIY